MERTNVPSVQTEIEFLLSLLRISTPGEPAERQTEAMEQLLATATAR